MESLGELFFIHSDFSLTSLLTNDYSLNHKNFYYVNSVFIVKNSTSLKWKRFKTQKVLFNVGANI